MVELSTLTSYIDNLLDITVPPEDPSNNGLQVEGKQEVSKIVFGVDACLALSKRAAEQNADLIFVHHGLSWYEGFKRLTGYSAQIFSILFKNDISLYGAHLPLDAHHDVGHNVQIAKLIGLKNTKSFAEHAKIEIGIMGELQNSIHTNELVRIINRSLHTESKVFGDSQKSIKSVGIISGGPGSTGVQAAIDAKLDCLITGEVHHGMWHLMQDTGINVIAAGHYCTEKPGVVAVMQKIQEKFDIDCQFVDLPTGL